MKIVQKIGNTWVQLFDLDISENEMRECMDAIYCEITFNTSIALI